ncbi:MAG: polymerase sigma-70 factor, subfamily, partial [Phycisphaerales bacterium]|nr:polymerase sigma-70 factor, subfamily [Phycisphaerales bacterium]
MPDDTELLAQIGRGDQAAFRTLLDRHARYLYGVAHAMTGNSTEAEDIVQETLVGALASAGKFRGESSARTWLVRILINRVRMWRRTRKSRGLDETTSVTGSLASSSAPVSSGVDAKLDLTQMLAQLTP